MDNNHTQLPPRSSRIDQQRLRKTGEDGKAHTATRRTNRSARTVAIFNEGEITTCANFKMEGGECKEEKDEVDQFPS